MPRINFSLWCGLLNSPNVSSAYRKRRNKRGKACGLCDLNSPIVSSVCQKSVLKEASSPRKRDGEHRAGNPCLPVIIIPNVQNKKLRA